MRIRRHGPPLKNVIHILTASPPAMYRMDAYAKMSRLIGTAINVIAGTMARAKTQSVGAPNEHTVKNANLRVAILRTVIVYRRTWAAMEQTHA